MKPNIDLPQSLPQELPPQAALALFDLLYGLTDALWQRYGSELIERMMEERDQYPDASQQCFDFNDELPPF